MTPKNRKINKFVFSSGSKIKKTIDKLIKPIEPMAESLLASCVDEKNRELVRYQIKTGGKRIRPALAIISSLLLGGKEKEALCPAVGLEILHNYTLIIDDIIDKSVLRRGKPTVWFKFGKSIAQCVGVYYSAAIFQAANLAKESVKISELFVRTIKTVADGEILDILFEQKGREDEKYVLKNRYFKISEKDYFKMAGEKTAFLFQACCEAGGITANASKKEISALKSYGFNLGLAFQIQDDILDVFGKEKEFGKEIGKDIKERKGGNVVIVLALKELNLNDRKKLLKILRQPKIDKKDIKTVMDLIEKTASHQKAIEVAGKLIEQAKKSLEVLPKNKWNDILSFIADFTVIRER